MSKYKLSHAISVCCLCLFALLFSMPLQAQDTENTRKGEHDTYRRSSLCLMLITHENENYAQAIEEQFKAMPLPSRYNSLNVDVRVISTKKKVTDGFVTSELKERGVAKELVGKWFNRNSSGVMNMERIHQWGGYNASFQDLKRAQSTERGVALLSDEGTELIQNTFVMVCDISYYDRSTTGDWLGGLLAVGAAMLDQAGQAQAKKGNQSSANTYSTLATTVAAGSEVAQDIAGFSVNVMARLYQLKWNNSNRDQLYSRYWVDEETSASEANSRKQAFDRDANYELEYLGSYRSRSGKTVSRSGSDLDMVIREVCSEAVERSINNLSKMFPVFKPKTPFYCDNNYVYAYIGSKEGVTNKSKYEVLETEKTDKGISYHKVAELKPRDIWDNTGIYMSDDSLEQKYKGTSFTHTSGKNDICDQGLMLREMGKLGFQYKRNVFLLNLSVGKCTVSRENALKAMEKKEKKLEKLKKISIEKFDPTVFGLDLGWMINYHTNYAWNVINAEMGYGTDYLELGATTGFMFRTNPLGKRGKYALFVWPTAGYRFTSATLKYLTYSTEPNYNSSTKTYSYDRSTQSNEVKSVAFNSFDWNIKAGVTLSEKMSLAYSYNDLRQSLNLTFYF